MTCFDDLQKLQKAYGRLLEPVCRRWNLTRNELDVLLFLHNNPHLDRAADIVSCRGIAKSHVSASVASLERRSFLHRRTDSADRRTVHLSVTQAAQPVVDAGLAAQRSFGALLVAGLTPQQLEQGRQLTEAVRRNIEKLEDL